MNNTQIPEYFFEMNPLEEMSAAMLTHFRMLTITMSEVNDKIDEVVMPVIDKPRQERCQAERESIINMNNAEDIVACMRKIKDPMNNGVLIKKALEYQEDVIPLVLKKVRTSGYDVFIENAAILLANADTKYTEQLYAIFSEIRNTYARSELCIVFGVKKKTEYVPLLLEQYQKIKEERPDKSYEQGPLLALYLLSEEM